MVNTQYPFEDKVEVLLKPPNIVETPSMPLRVRVPVWANNAVAWHNDRRVSVVRNGSMLLVHCNRLSLCNLTLELNPEICLETGWFDNAVSVMRGIL